MDGTRTRNENEADPAENEADRGSQPSPESTELPPAPDERLRQPPVTGSEPTDSDLEAAIVRAMLDGRGEVAELLARQLKTRQAARAGNVVPFDATKRRGGVGWAR